jgi:uncharacterized membrane protein YesL
MFGENISEESFEKWKEMNSLKGASNMMGGIYSLSEWIMRFSLTNLIWVFLNLPIAFLLFNILFMGNREFLFFSVIPLIILLPFLFFPATAAMFSSVREWVIKDEKTSIRQYWKQYKENYKISFLGGLVLTALWTVWAADYYYFSQKNPVFTIGFLVIGVVLFVFTINFFSVISHYHLKLTQALKNTAIITFGSPALFFAVLITNSIILYMSLFGFPFLLPFFTGSLIAYLSFLAFYKFYYLKVSA